MKAVWQPLKIIMIAVATIFGGLATTRSQPFPLLTMSNAIPTDTPGPHSIEVGTNPVIPVIEMHDAPMSTVIESLARAGNINFIFDARLTDWWGMPDAKGDLTHEPVLTLRWQHLTAKEALLQVLGEHHLVLAEDALTTIARITYTNQSVNPGDAALLKGDTNLVPWIQFQDVPITLALENLARQAGIGYVLDPKIGYGMPDKHGQIKAEPSLSLRWEHVTATQAFVAICENYDLVVRRDPTSGIALIRAKGHSISNFLDANLFGSDTNGAVLIQMEEVRLGEALKQLAKKANLKVVIEPSRSGERQIPVI